MTSKFARLALLGATLVLGACTTSGGLVSSAPSVPLDAVLPSLPVTLQASATATAPSPTPEATATAAPSPSSAEAASTPGTIDPCTLLTQDEASGYIGVKLGPGKIEVVTPDTVCTWAKGTTKLKIFLAPPTDPVAAKAYYEAHKAEIPAGGKITELPTFFDGSLIGSATLPIGTISGIFVLEGNHFFELYCEIPACSDKNLMDGATLIDGRLH
ncbi:MAG TPA: hypothetical protein VGQ31_06160 [Candidatus Limnocylindrales bacterium]|nr:hypothetical protein [Candidatus Limnocylindrales bacterium]